MYLLVPESGQATWPLHSLWSVLVRSFATVNKETIASLRFFLASEVRLNNRQPLLDARQA